MAVLVWHCPAVHSRVFCKLIAWHRSSGSRDVMETYLLRTRWTKMYKMVRFCTLTYSLAFASTSISSFFGVAPLWRMVFSTSDPPSAGFKHPFFLPSGRGKNLKEII